MTTLMAMPLSASSFASGSSTTITTTTTPTATASGLLALLSESDPTLVKHALTRLLSVVDTLWHEVAEALPDLEAIAEGGGGPTTAAKDDDAAMMEDDANNATTANEDEGRYHDEQTRRIAAALASRVFFHLEEPHQALRLALESGDVYFDVLSPLAGDASYVERLVNTAIGEYVKRKRIEFINNNNNSNVEEDAVKRRGKKQMTTTTTTTNVDTTADDDNANNDDDEPLDMTKLTKVVQLMFQRCYNNGSYVHALGVAFESCEGERVQEILDELLLNSSSSSVSSMLEIVNILQHAMTIAQSLISSKLFRSKALSMIATSLDNIFTSVSASESAKRHAACALVLCYQLLNDALSVGKIITHLIDDNNGNDDSALLGLQLCFDIVDSGDQKFVANVASCLPTKKEPTVVVDTTATAATANEHGVEVVNETTALLSPPAMADELGVEVEEDGGGSIIRSDSTWKHFTNATRVLTGGFTSELSLSFLFKNSNADTLIMSNLKKSLEERSMSRNSVLHNCAVTTHGYMNAGTTNDDFLRDNLDWMKKASNWAKFSATASMGVIHAGHTSEAMTLLEPYLPPSAPAEGGEAPTVSSTGGYAEGGSLYALGLIHGSHAGSSTVKRLEASQFLRNHLRNSHANEVISHGAALGVGLTSFGSSDLDVVNELKELLYTDSAVAGEAAAYSMGMVLVGSGAGNASSSANEELTEIVTELRNYSRETHHEKIIRGISMCLALVNFGQEENADATIEEMRADRDPIIRYGAMYGLALAYCGTGSNKAIRILLHTAVSDVSDDVRMASVIGLALVLHKTPKRVPELVRLLLESFNPHVRYASCMAVGIAMAGSGDSESVALLEPMLTDMADHVRQGAILGTAMIYMQQGDSCNHRKIKTFRDKLASLVSDKHQTTLTKMGAIMSMGLIDVGGRNCALSLSSRNGFTKMTSAAGLVLWLQHWHWYPLMHMLSVAITPTVTVALNKDFKYPKKFEIVCNSKPSVYAYPKKLEEKKEETKKRVETVALSATAKNKARMARKRVKEEEEVGEAGEEGAMEVDKKTDDDDEEETTEEEGKEKVESMDVDGGDDKAALASEETKPKKKREPEPTSFSVSNPARITMAQANVCAFDLSQRYRPIRPEEKPYGVIMLTDSTPDEEEEVSAVKTPAQEDEADPPEPFEWTPPDHPDHPDYVATTEAVEGSTDADATGVAADGDGDATKE